MKKINEYWVDDNNNRWSSSLYTKEKAIELSRGLIQCRNCIDCMRCYGCYYCDGCRDCTFCESCNYCKTCMNCSNINDRNNCYALKL